MCTPSNPPYYCYSKLLYYTYVLAGLDIMYDMGMTWVFFCFLILLRFKITTCSMPWTSRFSPDDPYSLVRSMKRKRKIKKRSSDVGFTALTVLCILWKYIWTPHMAIPKEARAKGGLRP